MKNNDKTKILYLQQRATLFFNIESYRSSELIVRRVRMRYRICKTNHKKTHNFVEID